MNEIINIGLIGYGKLGSAIAELFCNQEFLDHATKRKYELKLKAICEINKKSEFLKKVDADIKIFDKYEDLIDNSEIQIVIEAIGGKDVAYKIAKRVLAKGKFLITANKSLLAEKGNELDKIAQENNAAIGDEGVLLGGLPLLTMIKEKLFLEKIINFYGIVNGSTNFILSAMEKGHNDYESLVKLAEERGLMEKDKDLDLNGIDAAQKAIILAKHCFSSRLFLNDVYFQGIKDIIKEDFVFCEKLGYVIRLVMMACHDEQGKLNVSVTPTLVPKNNFLALIEENKNGIFIESEFSGKMFFSAKVAEAKETAIAVLQDVTKFADAIYKNEKVLISDPKNLLTENLKDYEEMVFPFYVRFMIKDQPGILASIAEIFSWYKINIRTSVDIDIYKNIDTKDKNDCFAIVIDSSKVRDVNEAVTEISGLKYFKEEPFVMRMLK